MTTILLGFSWRNAFMHDPKLQPLDGKFAQSQKTHRRKGCSVVGPYPVRHTKLRHRRFTNGVNMRETHLGNGLAANNVAAVTVSDCERVAALSVPATKISFK